MRGKFISFEGGEGGGKSTQATRLAGYLRAKGLDVVETREPGGTKQGEELRDLLVQGDPDRWSPYSELLMMTAARVEHVNRLIEPSLEEGKWVICDRFLDSTLTYQGIAGGLGLDVVRPMQQMAVGNTMPDLTTRQPNAIRVEPNLDWTSRGSAYPGLDSRFNTHWSGRFSGIVTVPGTNKKQNSILLGRLNFLTTHTLNHN